MVARVNGLVLVGVRCCKQQGDTIIEIYSVDVKYFNPTYAMSEAPLPDLSLHNYLRL
jgi:hypothetical protein